jgi:hypothetical protein
VEHCTGTSNDCPSNSFSPSTTVCRSSAGACDVAESCTGSDADCPGDGIASSGTTCRTVTGDCDVAEQCDGSVVTCPADSGNTQCNFRSSPQIAITGTTCQQYRDGTSVTLDAELYQLTKGKPQSQVINAISPGVFFLYDGLKLATSGTITVTEAAGGTWMRPIQVNQMQVILYDLSCAVQHVGTLAIASNGNVTITNVPAGSYILSVKYDPTTLAGYHPPTPSSTYTFTTQANGLASGSAGVLVTNKK